MVRLQEHWSAALPPVRSNVDMLLAHSPVCVVLLLVLLSVFCVVFTKTMTDCMRVC